LFAAIGTSGANQPIHKVPPAQKKTNGEKKALRKEHEERVRESGKPNGGGASRTIVNPLNPQD